MDQKEILEKFEHVGAVRHGHFKLTSGRHSDTYIQCARVQEHPHLTVELAREAVAHLPKDLNVDLIASPAMGGILWGFPVAYVMDKKMIFAERKNGKMVFRRNFEVPKGARVLICEDVVTTGGSVKEVCDLVESAGGNVVAVCSMIDRGNKNHAFDKPFYPLLKLSVPSWTQDECELCKKGVPIDSPGSHFLK